MSSAPPPPFYSNDKPMNYPQMPPQPPPVAMVQPVYITSSPIIVGDYPMQYTCPHCARQIVTRTEKKSGLFAWAICGGLTFIGCWLCCCIPFCVDACKDTEHYCPNCNSLLGISKKL